MKKIVKIVSSFVFFYMMIFISVNVHAANHSVSIHSVTGWRAVTKVTVSQKSNLVYYVIEGNKSDAYSYINSANSMISDNDNKITELAGLNTNSPFVWDKLVQMGTKVVPKGTSTLNIDNLTPNKQYTLMVYTYLNTTKKSTDYKNIFTFTEFKMAKNPDTPVSISSAQAKNVTAYTQKPTYVNLKYKTTMQDSLVMVMTMDYSTDESQMIVYKGTPANRKTTFTNLTSNKGFMVSVIEQPTKAPLTSITSYPTAIFYTGVKLNATTKTIEKGKTFTFVPQNMVLANELTWTSNKPKVVSVNASGKITGVATGVATITAKTKNGLFSVKCVVTVKKSSKTTPATSVKLSMTTAYLPKGSFTLKATMAPSNTTDTIKWTSSNTKVATVSSKGVVSKVKAGTAKITATTSSGKKATCTVTVK